MTAQSAYPRGPYGRYARRVAADRRGLAPLDVLVLEDLEKRAAETGRSVLDCGVLEIADGLQAPLRSVQRSLQRLQSAGKIESRKRGRRQTALITLIQGQSGPVTLAGANGFIGERTALGVVQALARKPVDTRSPLDLALTYLESASPREQARINSLSDEHGLYANSIAITGHAKIDEGIRQIAINNWRRAQQKKLVASLPRYQDEIEGA